MLSVMTILIIYNIGLQLLFKSSVKIYLKIKYFVIRNIFLSLHFYSTSFHFNTFKKIFLALNYFFKSLPLIEIIIIIISFFMYNNLAALINVVGGSALLTIIPNFPE